MAPGAGGGGYHTLMSMPIRESMLKGLHFLPQGMPGRNHEAGPRSDLLVYFCFKSLQGGA